MQFFVQHVARQPHAVSRVNIEHIAGISAESLQLDNGDVIGAGRELILEVKQKVTAYWRKH